MTQNVIVTEFLQESNFLKRHQTSKPESCHINHQWPKKSFKATGKVKYQTFPETFKLREIGITVVIPTCVHSLQASRPIFAPPSVAMVTQINSLLRFISFRCRCIRSSRQAGQQITLALNIFTLSRQPQRAIALHITPYFNIFKTIIPLD